MITKAKEKAGKFHKHEMLIALIRAETMIDYRTFNAKQVPINTEKHFLELGKLINFCEGFRHYKKLYDLAYLANMERIKDDPRLLALSKERSLKTFKPKHGFYGENHFLALNAAHRTLRGDVKGSIPFVEKQIKLLEKNPDLIHDNPTTYFPLLNNLLGRYSQLGEEKKFFSGLAKLRALESKIISLRRNIFRPRIIQSVVLLELGYYMGNKSYTKGLERLPELIKESNPYKKSFDLSTTIVFHTIVSNILFFNKEYKECLKHIAEVNSKALVQIRKDLQQGCLLMRMAC